MLVAFPLTQNCDNQNIAKHCQLQYKVISVDKDCSKLQLTHVSSLHTVPGSGQLFNSVNIATFLSTTPVSFRTSSIYHHSSQACLVAQLVKNVPTIPGLGRSPGGGKGNSGLEISMDCLAHGVAKSRIQLSDFHLHHSSFWGKPLCSHLWKERFAGFGSDNGPACWLCFWVTQFGLNWEVNLVVSFLKLSHTHFLPFLSHFQWTYSQIAGSDKNDMYYAF